MGSKFKKEFEFKNGDEVKEKVTGFKGVITGTAFYLTGCNQYLVTAKPKDEFSEPVALWYDEGRLEFLENKVKPEAVKGKEKGSDKIPNVGRIGR